MNYCFGCNDNFYNGNNPYGIQECWNKKSAKHRKTLTLYLGECWHSMVDKGPYETTCNKCGMSFASIHYSDWDINKFYRTFTTPADLYAVYSKMVEKGEWEGFIERMWSIPPTGFIDTFTAWLSCYGCPEQIPERMKMAAEFLEGRGNENQDGCGDR